MVASAGGMAGGTGVEAAMGAMILGARPATGAGIGVAGWASAGDPVAGVATGAPLSSGT